MNIVPKSILKFSEDDKRTPQIRIFCEQNLLGIKHIFFIILCVRANGIDTNRNISSSLLLKTANLELWPKWDQLSSHQNVAFIYFVSKSELLQRDKCSSL